MEDTLLSPPFKEKLYVKPNVEAVPEGKLEFTEPNRQSDGEFLGSRARINEDELQQYMKDKEAETMGLLEKFGKKLK